MSIADLFDEIVAVARRKTDVATKSYERQVAVLGERVRVQAADDRHRRGVTRELIARGGAILLPADDIDLSPHTPVAGSVPLEAAAENPDEVGTEEPTASAHHRVGTGVDSSFENGWLTDR